MVSPELNPENLSGNRWLQLQQAIDDVDHLPFDEEFVDVMRELALYETVQFDQDGNEVCVANSVFFRGSTITSNITDRYITVNNLSLNSRRSGDNTAVYGNLEVNGRQIEISTIGDNIYLHYTNMPDIPAVPIEKSDITNFLLATAHGYIGEKKSSVEGIINMQSEATDIDEQLGATMHMMGQIFGRSTHTIRAFFDDGESALIADLSRDESPSNNDIHNGLLLSTPNTDFGQDVADEVLTANHQSLPDQESSVTMRRGAHQLVSRYAIDAAMDAYPFEEGPGAISAEYSDNEPAVAEEVRHYALLCEQLLAAYGKIVSARNS